MSAFAAVYHRDGSPAVPGEVDRMMARLSHCGPHGYDTSSAPGIALGHAHFWTTPEEVGEFQPLTDADRRLRIVFDGRLDNRAELLVALDWRDRKDLSDATIALGSFARWGDACFERFLGPFATAVYEEERHRLVVARDPVGDRTAFYCLHGKSAIVASEERAVLAHPEVSDAPDERRVAAFFALRVLNDGATFFKAIQELLPGHLLVVDSAGAVTRKFAEISARETNAGLSDAEYAEQFRDVLNKAVSCRLRSVSQPGIMMSGGLDSTAVTGLAAGQLRDHKLRTFTYVFDAFSSCDERAETELMRRRFGLDSVYVCGDDKWALPGFETQAVNLNTPEETPYRRLVNSVYATASEMNSTTLLTGVFGDHLYAGSSLWLGSLLREGRWREAFHGLGNDLRAAGVLSVLRGQPLRRALGLHHRLRPQPRHGAHWLTDFALQRWMDVRPSHGETGAFAARLATTERFHADACGVELRHPYRDRRVIEWMLSAPAHQLSRGGQTKFVLRESMKQTLPEEVRLRTRQTPVTPLYQRGLKKDWGRIQALLTAPEAEWPRYVRPECIADAKLGVMRSERQELVFWRCVSFEIWRRSRRFAASAQDSIQSSSATAALKAVS